MGSPKTGMTGRSDTLDHGIGAEEPVDGVSDFDALYSRQCDEQVQLYAFDVLAADGDDLWRLPDHAQGEPGVAARTPAGWDLCRTL
jgi:hypothetical protein